MGDFIYIIIVVVVVALILLYTNGSSDGFHKNLHWMSHKPDHLDRNKARRLYNMRRRGVHRRQSCNDRCYDKYIGNCWMDCQNTWMDCRNNFCDKNDIACANTCDNNRTECSDNNCHTDENNDKYHECLKTWCYDAPYRIRTKLESVE